MPLGVEENEQGTVSSRLDIRTAEILPLEQKRRRRRYRGSFRQAGLCSPVLDPGIALAQRFRDGAGHAFAGDASYGLRQFVRPGSLMFNPIMCLP